MKRPARRFRAMVLVFAVGMFAVAPIGCGGEVPSSNSSSKQSTQKTPAEVRAARRSFDGAPPVIPHKNFGMACISCHDDRGKEIPSVGHAPPVPHGKTKGMSEMSRCKQCHVFKQSDEVFIANKFEGLRQDLHRGTRLNDLSPPVIPHLVAMRENCFACHTGPAAREAIRCGHPERVRCLQCHVPRTAGTLFSKSNPE